MPKLILGLACLILGVSCTDFSKENRTNLIGLASPIQLEENDSTLILMEDYFIDPLMATDLQLPEGWKYEFSGAGDSLWVFSQTSPNTLYNLSFGKDTDKHDLLALSSSKGQVIISLADESYEEVQLKGEMTNWQLVDGQLQDGKWIFDFSLNPNAYQYMFLVDGREMLDPANEQQIDNGSGGFNSLLDLRATEEEKAARLVLRTMSHSDKQWQ